MRSFLAVLWIVFGFVAGDPALAIQQTYMPAVANLAHRLDDAATRIHRRAEADVQRFDLAELDTLRALRRFAASADRFHAMLASYSSEGAQVEAELDRMNDVADRIDDSIYESHATRRVTRDWTHAKTLLRDINRYFAAGSRGWEYP